MANNCLVTKLSASIKDVNLLKVNEMNFDFEASGLNNPTALNLTVNATASFRIVGNGYFTDKTGTENLGKEQTFTVVGGELTKRISLYLSSEVRKVIIDDKRKIHSFSSSASPLVTNPDTGSGDSGLYIINSVTDFMYATNTAGISTNNATKLQGDVKGFSKMVCMDGFYGGTLGSLYGDISAFKDLTKMKIFRFNNHNVTGDISAFKDIVSLTSFQIDCKNITGDLASLKNLNPSKHIIIRSADRLTGDLAQLNDDICYFSNESGNSKFTWTAKSVTRKDILFLNGVTLIDGADQYLIDQAELKFNPLTDGVWGYTINIRGNVTNTSSSAIEFLQLKGAIVIITPIN